MKRILAVCLISMLILSFTGCTFKDLSDTHKGGSANKIHTSSNNLSTVKMDAGKSYNYKNSMELTVNDKIKINDRIILSYTVPTGEKSPIMFWVVSIGCTAVCSILGGRVASKKDKK